MTGYSGHATVWTEEMIVHLITRFDAGATTAVIAAEISDKFNVKIGKSAVCGKIRRLRQDNRIVRPAVPQIKYKTPEERKARKNACKRQRRAKMAELRATPKPKLMAAPKPVVEPVPVVGPTVQVEPLGLTLLELERHQCHYPHGGDASVTFCGHPVEGKGVYCKAHAERCYQKVYVADPEKTAHYRTFGTGPSVTSPGAFIGRGHGNDYGG